MKVASLVVILRNDEVLLGFKKRGEIGKKTLNGPGGKKEEGESIIECAVREVQEEVGVIVRPNYLEQVAVITFYAAGLPDFEVYVFRTETSWGLARETEHMSPHWYPADHLPFDDMLESDREWFPRVISGEKFRANVYYRERAAGFERIEFFPY